MKPHQTSRRVRLLGLLGLAPLLLFGAVACGDDDDAGGSAASDSGGGAAATGDQISIVDFAFDPEELTVAPGTTVTWTNEDSSDHAIQDDSDLGADEGPDMGEGDTFELTYDDPGEYPYICGIHNYMQGTVVVE